MMRYSHPGKRMGRVGIVLAASLLLMGTAAAEAEDAVSSEVRPASTRPFPDASARLEPATHEGVSATQVPEDVRRDALPEDDVADGVGMPARTDPAASRGPKGCSGQVQALAPARGIGRTAEASPTLHWKLSEATSCRIEFVLNDPRSTTPRLERELPGPHDAGIHAVRLAEHGVVLEPGVVYTWFIQLVPDPDARSKDTFSGGPIERVASVQDGATPWYDALADRRAKLVSHPDDLAGREALVALLAAEGISDDASTAPDVASGPPPIPSTR